MSYFNAEATEIRRGPQRITSQIGHDPFPQHSSGVNTLKFQVLIRYFAGGLVASLGTVENRDKGAVQGWG